MSTSVMSSEKMHISTKLPEKYGSFNPIREENYPFNQIFEAYIRAIVEVGVSHHLDPIGVVGYIEDELIGDERAPSIEDLEPGDKIVNFRFTTEDIDIINYYRNSTSTNRLITTMIVKMTLRLCLIYGPSLPRIMTRIQTLVLPDSDMGRPSRVSGIRVSTPIKVVPVQDHVQESVQIKQPVNSSDSDALKARLASVASTLGEDVLPITEVVDDVENDSSDDQTIETNTMLSSFWSGS